MCGRYTLKTPPEIVAEQFQLEQPLAIQPRYNVVPSQLVACIRTNPASIEREGVFLWWGLIPSWAKDPKIGMQLINARAETLAEKPSFRAAFRHRRCLVLADGFYEWRREGRSKQPYFVRFRDERPFAFGGLWEPGSGSNSLKALIPETGEWVVLRVPYPQGFYSRGMDGRIDDPDGGWKGRGIYTTSGADAAWHIEGGPEQSGVLVKFQIRPDPLAN